MLATGGSAILAVDHKTWCKYSFNAAHPSRRCKGSSKKLIQMWQPWMNGDRLRSVRNKIKTVTWKEFQWKEVEFCFCLMKTEQKFDLFWKPRYNSLIFQSFDQQK